MPRPRLSPEELAHDIHESLLRLQTDYIDLFLLHRDDPSIPASTIIEHLNQEIRAGNLRAIGASNWELERLQEANEYAAEHELHGFIVSSNNISLAVPMEPMWKGVVSVSETAWEWHNETQLLPWSSQARGFFSGRFAPENQDNQDMVRVYYNDANFERLTGRNTWRKERVYADTNFTCVCSASTISNVGPLTHEELSSCPALNPTIP